MSLWRIRISTRVPKPINPYPKIGNPFENEWLEKFVRADRFDVRICSVIFGYLIDPISKKMIYADISFEEDERFGGFVFDGMNSRWNDEPALVPLVHVWLGDEKSISPMFEAHRDAILSGVKYSQVRFWKLKSDSRKFEYDGKSIASGGSGEISGLQAWSVLQSRGLANYELSFGDVQFSIDELGS